jgi:hypothetical protein
MDGDSAAAGAHLANDQSRPDAQNVHDQLRRLDIIESSLLRFGQPERSEGLPGTAPTPRNPK